MGAELIAAAERKTGSRRYSVFGEESPFHAGRGFE
jgi:hypothetical protein